MRKYFLLSAVALMAATTANATTDYAEVTAKATIEVAGQLDCSNSIDFGTIVVKQNNAESTVVLDENYEILGEIQYTGDIISVTNASSFPRCGLPDISITNASIPENIVIKSGTESLPLKLTSSIGSDGVNIYATLTIPAKVKAGDYTGSFTVTATY